MSYSQNNKIYLENSNTRWTNLSISSFLAGSNSSSISKSSKSSLDENIADGELCSLELLLGEDPLLVSPYRQPVVRQLDSWVPGRIKSNQTEDNQRTLLCYMHESNKNNRKRQKRTWSTWDTNLIIVSSFIIWRQISSLFFSPSRFLFIFCHSYTLWVCKNKRAMI